MARSIHHVSSLMFFMQKPETQNVNIVEYLISLVLSNDQIFIYAIKS